MLNTPVTDIAVTITPIPTGPSARGTTIVQRSVIVHVITWPGARTPALRPTREGSSTGASSRASPATASGGPRSSALFKERERSVEAVGACFFGTASDRPCRDAADDRERRHVARDDRAGRDD